MSIQHSPRAPVINNPELASRHSNNGHQWPSRNQASANAHSSTDSLVEGREMKFQIGDKVREGTRLGTVIDVGTVLIQVETAVGASRMVCPWELVRIGP